jgi:hypothetical protein
MALIAKGVQKCSAPQTAFVPLANTSRKMAQLELEAAIQVLKIDLICLTLSKCKDQIFHLLQTGNIGNTAPTLEALTYLCFQYFGDKILYFIKLLYTQYQLKKHILWCACFSQS